jgi:hypothetical protein
MTALGLCKNYSEGEWVEITWDSGDMPLLCKIIKIERGFLVMEESGNKKQVVARPESPYKIKKIAVQ